MIFKNSFNNQKIEQAADLANTFLMTVQLIDIQKIAPFTYLEEVKPEDHASAVFLSIKSLQYLRPEIEIVPWYPFNRWTKAIATTFKNDGKIYINARKVDAFEVENYVNTLTHETCHKLNFGHGSNFKTTKKISSVPYSLGALAEAWARSREARIAEVLSEVGNKETVLHMTAYLRKIKESFTEEDLKSMTKIPTRLEVDGVAYRLRRHGEKIT